MTARTSRTSTISPNARMRAFAALLAFTHVTNPGDTYSGREKKLGKS